MKLVRENFQIESLPGSWSSVPDGHTDGAARLTLRAVHHESARKKRTVFTIMLNQCFIGESAQNSSEK